MTTQQETGLILNTSAVEKINQRQQRRGDSHRPVSFLLESEIYALTDSARAMRDGLRNETLLLILFQVTLRVSECLDLKLRDKQFKDGSHFLIIEHGKGDKPRLCGIPESLYLRIGNYCSEAGITKPEDNLFNISRVRVWQIIQQCARNTRLDYKRIYCHLFRHSGAIARLKRSGNIGTLRVHMGHSDTKMSLRYLSTVQQLEAVTVESKVNFDR